MDPEAPDDAEHRLAERAEELDKRIAAGELPTAIDPDAYSPAELATLRSAHESLLRLERVWPRGGASPTVGESAPADPGHGEPPPVFGRFRVVRELGRGGFGIVLLAIDPELGRPVALKLPRAESLLDARGRERFVREARAVAGLDHPNIAPLYEAGEVHGVCYMASAYCDGPDLARWLREQTGRIAPRTAARIVAELADAISHAHDRGVLHRDLKPSNVLLQRRPPADRGPSDLSPRIVDFGLARLMDGDSGDLTASHVAVGSAPYMAPEQAEGKRVGPAADIYGLGALLYAMLCGRPPHRGRSELDTLRRVVADEVIPPRRLRRDLPRDLEAICLKCLEKDPARRYHDAVALGDDLRRFLAGSPALARSRGRWDRARRAARRYRRPLAALGIVATAAAAVLAGLSRYDARIREARDLAGRRAEEARRSREAEGRARYVADLRRAESLLEAHHARPAIALLDRHRPGPGEPDRRGFAWRYLRGRCDTARRTLAGFAGPVYFAEFSPAGDLLAAAGKDGNVRIWETASWGLLRAFRADAKEVNVAAFSPDGGTLATVGDEGMLRLWDVATGRRLLERPAHRGDAVVARFTPDGRSLFTGGRKDGLLKVWDVGRGAEARSLPAPAPVFESAAVSADGRFLATGGGGAMNLWEIPRLSRVAGTPQLFDSVQAAAFSADGRTLAIATEGSKRAILLEVPSLRPIREFLGHTEGVFAVVFSADGRTLYSGGDDQMIRCWDVATGGLKAIHHGHTGRVWGLAVSPDGRTLASAGGDGRVKLWDPMPPRGHDTIAIEERPVTLRFSRDGDRLATLDRRGQFTIRETKTGRIVRSRPLAPIAGPGAVFGPTTSAFVISEDLRTVLIADTAGRVVACYAEEDRASAVLGEGEGPVPDLGVMADGEHAYIARQGRRLEFWGLRPARRLGRLEGPYDAAFGTPAGPQLLIHEPDRDWLAIWDPSRGEITRPTPPIRFLPWRLAFSPDGRLLALSNRFDDQDHRVRIVETDGWVERPNPIASPEPVLALAFDPTGRILAGACEDRRVRLWDIAGGEVFLILEGHSGPVLSAHFFPDGRALATDAQRPDGSREVFLWRTARP